MPAEKKLKKVLDNGKNESIIGLINQRYGDKLMTTLKDLIRTCWTHSNRLYELQKNGIIYRMSYEGGVFVVSMQANNGYLTRFISGDMRNFPMDIDIDDLYARQQKQVLKSIQYRYSTVKFLDKESAYYRACL